MELDRIPGVDQKTAELYFKMQDAAGWESAAKQAIEEAAELIQAVSKLMRANGSGCATPKKQEEVWDNLIEEWSDLNAMMRLLMRKFGTDHDDDLAQEIVMRKTQRYIDRNYARYVAGELN